MTSPNAPRAPGDDTAALDTWVARMLHRFPPLTPGQRDRISTLLRVPPVDTHTRAA